MWANAIKERFLSDTSKKHFLPIVSILLFGPYKMIQQLYSPQQPTAYGIHHVSFTNTNWYKKT